MKRVTFEVMPEGAGDSMVVSRLRPDPMDLRADEWRALAPLRITEARLPVHSYRLATQEIRVAFDPETQTLYIGERHRHGWIEDQLCHLTRAAGRAATLASKAHELLKSRKPSQRRRGRRLVARLAGAR